MIYFDNSASTFKKPKEVVSAIYNSMIKLTANPGRSGHKPALDSAIAVNDVREYICEMFGANRSERVIFTQNCTDALNLAIQGTVLPNAHIITTINEHNSVLRPLYELKDKIGIEISICEPKNNQMITVDDILPLIKPNTQMICVNHMSNVDGMTADIKSIGELCQEHCITFLVDGAQSAGHLPINMQNDNIDLLALAPHKALYGPQGIGVLCYSLKAKLKPIRFGGTGTESISLKQPLSPPECFESGTVATPNIVGLGAGAKFTKNNFDRISKKIDDLSTYLNFELRNIDGVKCYTHPDNCYGVLSFNIKDAYSSDISDILSNRFNICTRSGLHCAPLKHKWLKTTQQGTVRVSLSYFNTFSECEKFIKAIKIIAKEF